MLWLALLLVGCSAPAEALPFTADAPPAVVEVSPILPGEPLHLRLATGVGAGLDVRFFLSVSPRRQVPCLPVGGGCLDLVQPRTLGQATTDRQGTATLHTTAPAAAAPDTEVRIQAIVHGPNGRVGQTGVVTAVVLDPADDPDHDGLTNLDEVALRTRVNLADTDGGGALDGEEVLFDHTDPLAPGDDVPGEQACGDHLDDDLDGLVDCRDPDCPACVEICTDGVDNDFDGAVDCRDRNCPACVEVCDDGVDNDFDGAVDCRDYDCAAACVEVCDNGVDDNDNGRTDCDDLNCHCPESCDNGVDDDRDVLIDCDDPDCACPELCTDGSDGDGDGLADCADPDCAGACGEVCDNGVDDDSDGLADCEDGSCTDLCVEVCGNGADDDGDAWIDCEDEECWASCGADEQLAWVEAATVRVVKGRFWNNASTAIGYCGSSDGRSTNVRANDVMGHVRVKHASRVDSCSWRVDRLVSRHVTRTINQSVFVPPPASWTQTYWWGGNACVGTSRTSNSMYRSRFRIAPGCGIAGTSFLPQEVDPTFDLLPGAIFFSYDAPGTITVTVPQVGTGRPVTWYNAMSAFVNPFGQPSVFHGGQSSAMTAHADFARSLTPFGTCDVGTPVLLAGYAECAIP